MIFFFIEIYEQNNEHRYLEDISMKYLEEKILNAE